MVEVVGRDGRCVVVVVIVHSVVVVQVVGCDGRCCGAFK